MPTITITTVGQYWRACAAKLDTEQQLKRQLRYLPHLRDLPLIRTYRAHLAQLTAAINAYRGQD